MIRSLMLAALLLEPAALTHAQPRQTAAVKGPDSIKVTVSGVRSEKGRVRIELWTSGDGFPRKTEHAAKTVWVNAAQAVDGSVTATFADLEPGSYAVAAMHDENNNSKLDTGAFGVPKEGWAVSNNVTSRTHAPRFEEAKLQVTMPDQATVLKLHY